MVAGVGASAVLTPWVSGARRAAGGGRVAVDLLACFEEAAEGVVRELVPGEGRGVRAGQTQLEECVLPAAERDQDVGEQIAQFGRPRVRRRVRRGQSQGR